MNTSTGGVEPLPVETGVWIVVLGELCVFTLFFATFLYYRAQSPEIFESSSLMLRRDLGALNTMILLASSWCVASATSLFTKEGGFAQARLYLLSAVACGVAFVVIKVFEYASVIRSGLTIVTDDFFMFYFMLTGIHLMHLLVGLALLGATLLHLRNALADHRPVNDELVGFASCFWHMIDIVWIVLFPLLYLLR